MMLKKWCMSEVYWIDLKCLSVCCSWDLNYAKLFENMSCWIVYILWRNYALNDFKVFDETLDCLVLREHDLAKHDFTVWYSNETYTDQVQSIEHVDRAYIQQQLNRSRMQ
jgi:hypothetical protein